MGQAYVDAPKWASRKSALAPTSKRRCADYWIDSVENREDRSTVRKSAVVMPKPISDWRLPAARVAPVIGRAPRVPRARPGCEKSCPVPQTQVGTDSNRPSDACRVLLWRSGRRLGRDGVAACGGRPWTGRGKPVELGLGRSAAGRPHGEPGVADLPAGQRRQEGSFSADAAHPQHWRGHALSVG